MICTGNTKINNKWHCPQVVHFLVREPTSMRSLLNNNSNNSAVRVKKGSPSHPRECGKRGDI